MRAASTTVLLATGAVFASALVNSLPAQADTEASASQNLTFNKGTGPTTGTLTYGDLNRTKATWRAGSGHGPNWSNPCRRNEGNLPNGVYRLAANAWEVHHTGRINGRAVHLPNTRCSDGTDRTQLFIHSEQTADNTQGSTESTRWDGDNDYMSEGCIKLSPADIASLYKYHAAGPNPNDVVVNVIS